MTRRITSGIATRFSMRWVRREGSLSGPGGFPRRRAGGAGSRAAAGGPFGQLRAEPPLPELGTRNQEPGTRNQEPGTRNGMLHRYPIVQRCSAHEGIETVQSRRLRTHDHHPLLPPASKRRPVIKFAESTCCLISEASRFPAEFSSAPTRRRRQANRRVGDQVPGLIQNSRKDLSRSSTWIVPVGFVGTFLL